MPRLKPLIPCKSDWLSVNSPFEAILVVTPTSVRQASPAAPPPLLVTPKHGSFKPLGKVCEGGENSSSIFGARVERARVARKRKLSITSQSTPTFQLSVLPTVE